MHRPAETSVTVVPETVQTGFVEDVKVTVSVDVAEALSAGGVWSNRRAPIAPKVMVWLVRPMENDCGTVGAAFQSASPA